MLPTEAKKSRKPTNPTAIGPSRRSASTARAVTYPHSATVSAPNAMTSQASDRFPRRIWRGSASLAGPPLTLDQSEGAFVASGWSPSAAHRRQGERKSGKFRKSVRGSVTVS